MQYCGHIPWHRHVNLMIIVIPIQGWSDNFFPFPVFRDCIILLQCCLNDMHASLQCTSPWSHWWPTTHVPPYFDSSHASANIQWAVLGSRSLLWQFIYALFNLDIHKTIQFSLVMQLVVMNDFVWNIGKPEQHILRPFQWCAQKNVYFNCHEFCSIHSDHAIKQNFDKKHMNGGCFKVILIVDAVTA